jgi:hypothetical protein
MKKRCYNPNCKDFKWYGGKGIKICDEWRNDYLKFREWSLGNGHITVLTIDRVDNTKDYEPSNCQWLTQSENSKKRQREGKIQVLEYHGEKHGLRDWSIITGINQTTLQTRIRNGWSVERALTEGVHK